MGKLNPRELGRVEGILKSLRVDRKLSCALVKDYATLKTSSLKGNLLLPSTTSAEVSLKDQLESILRDSVAAVKDLESLSDVVGEDSVIPNCDLAVRDIIQYWKNDVALRIVLLSNLPLCDTLDLQRLLFMWLDSPYAAKLPLADD